MLKGGLSVFLPTYNEEENIQKAVESIYNYIEKNILDFELIVVNDGSKDKTKDIVEKLKKKYKNLRLINHTKNMGYGRALRSGFENSRKKHIFYTDADNQFDISEIKKLIPLLKEYDIVSGYRIKRRDPLMRIIIADTYNLLIRILFNLKIRDVDASFKIYKRRIFDNISLKSNTGLIDAEVLIKSLKNGYSIGQIGVSHFPRRFGRTTYEVGTRNKIFAFVRPEVIIDILKEIKILWKELR
ncbi:MAG: glycosyltransferase family 2 protein [Candidatus Levybacteria bacterium]|nr:glycosyltransferase family 2 protein [Candidatus Levybacteria bacterium]